MKPFARRDLAKFAAAAVVALNSRRPLVAQTPPASPPLAAGDALQPARDSKRSAAEELAKFPLEISTEPACVFKA
jgi:hypothetical protein